MEPESPSSGLARFQLRLQNRQGIRNSHGRPKLEKGHKPQPSFVEYVTYVICPQSSASTNLPKLSVVAKLLQSDGFLSPQLFLIPNIACAATKGWSGFSPISLHPPIYPHDPLDGKAINELHRYGKYSEIDNPLPRIYGFGFPPTTPHRLGLRLSRIGPRTPSWVVQCVQQNL